MADPNSQTSLPLQNLSSNQAIRLLGKVHNLNLNATGDNAFPIINATKYSVKDVVIANSSITTTVSSAVLAIYPSPEAAGTAILSSADLSAITGPTVIIDSAPTVTTIQTAQVLYARVTVAQGAACTVDLLLYGYDLDVA